MEIDFKLLKGISHIQIPVYVNGEGPFDFTLDTGARATSLSKSLVEKLGIETYPDDQREPDSIAHEKARVNALRIGSEILEEEELWVVDFQKVLSPCSVNMGGVIGYTTLKNYRMSVNYRSKVLKLERNHNSRSSEASNLQWADYEYAGESHLVEVPVFINGKGPFEFIVDTGAGATVVTPQLADKLRLSPSSPEEILAVAPGGSGGVHLTVLKNFAVLSVVQQDVTAVIMNMKRVTPRSSLIRNGILGFTFLKELEMIIDYPAKKIAFNDKLADS
ncbi:MAG: aspartyl protease family protein [Candidatus Thorarchaeota archaeon]